MEIEKVYDGIRYTLSNEDLKTNDKVYPIASGRCINKDEWILHSISFDPAFTGFPEEPHIILELNYSKLKYEEVRTNYGYSPKNCYYKIIKAEKKIICNEDALFKNYKWVEVPLSI